MSLIRIDATTEPLLTEVRCAKQTLPSLRWYLFGSALTAKRPVGDIDLLVIYQTPDQPNRVRRQLSSLAATIPLHLVFMTEEESLEVEFVSETRAVEIT